MESEQESHLLVQVNASCSGTAGAISKKTQGVLRIPSGKTEDF